MPGPKSTFIEDQCHQHTQFENVIGDLSVHNLNPQIIYSDSIGLWEYRDIKKESHTETLSAIMFTHTQMRINITHLLIGLNLESLLFKWDLLYYFSELQSACESCSPTL